MALLKISLLTVRNLRTVMFLFTTGMLVACASPAIKPSISHDAASINAQHLKSLADISSFSIQGRIGIQTNPKGFSGSLIWQHSDNTDDIALYSPLGSQVASINSTATQITLLDASGKSYSAANAETLTEDVLGWRLPLKGLTDWALGRPRLAPIKHSEWNAQGQLTLVQQDGWHIEYSNYQQQGAYTLPSKIYLKSEQLNIKLLVEKWDAPEQ